jgi:hypothetical protein
LQILESQGYAPGGPELDLGSNWGESHTVRVSYAPYAGRDDGFVYAYDRDRDLATVLCTATTVDAAQQAWQLVVSDPPLTDGHLLLADILKERQLSPSSARTLWRHCLERELQARAAYDGLPQHATGRMASAQAVVVAEAARVSSEDLSIGSVSTDASQPFVGRYRSVERAAWSGRVAAADLHDLADQLHEARALLAEHGRRLQPTSVTHGNGIVAAARVPELADLVDVPRRELGITPTL